MGSNVIQRLNKNNSQLLNKDNSDYKALFGKYPFVSLTPVNTSSDINCGALANELEFLRKKIDEAIASFDINRAGTDLLEELVQLFIDFRRTLWENDPALVNRFKAYIQRDRKSTRLNSSHGY